MTSVCVIGGGRWGKNHLNTLASIGALSGLIDSNPSTLAHYKSLFPNIRFFSSLDEEGALDFDAYTLPLPAEYHYDVAKKLLVNGKHVLVEKPITLSSVHAKELIDIAKKNQLILSVGHVLLFHPAFVKMKELITTGVIGKRQYLYSNRLNLGNVRTEENSLWSFAPHDISLFQYLIGSNPTHVSSSGGAFLQTDIHDTTITTLEYPNNISGHIFVSWLHPFKEHRFVVIGSKGMLVYEDSSQAKKLILYEKGIDWINGEPINRDRGFCEIEFEQTMPLTEELRHFIRCVEGTAQNTINDGQNGYDVLRILEQAQESLFSKHPHASHNSSHNPSHNPSHHTSDHTSAISKQPASTTPTTPTTPSGVEFDASVYVDPSAIVDANVTIGPNTKIWHFSHIQSHAVIGKNCILGQNVNVASNVTIGDFCKIQNNVSLYEGVTLEDYVFCGPSMVFTNIKNPRCKYPQNTSKHYIKTHVKQGASIGANATIVCGITLGRHCCIGAGSVVTKSVPDFAVITGTPGRINGWMSEAGTKLDFSKTNTVFCEKSGKHYTLSNGIVTDN